MLDVFTTLHHALEECFLPADLAMATFHDQTMKHFSMTEDAGYLFVNRDASRIALLRSYFASRIVASVYEILSSQTRNSVH